LTYALIQWWKVVSITVFLVFEVVAIFLKFINTTKSCAYLYWSLNDETVPFFLLSLMAQNFFSRRNHQYVTFIFPHHTYFLSYLYKLSLFYFLPFFSSFWRLFAWIIRRKYRCYNFSNDALKMRIFLWFL